MPSSSYARRGAVGLFDSGTEGSCMTAKPKVYALSTCPYCKRTRRFLDDHKIAYDCIEVDLLDDPKQDEVLDEIEKLTGRRSFPVVIIGKEIIVGHDETKLRKALGL